MSATNGNNDDGQGLAILLQVPVLGKDGKIHLEGRELAPGPQMTAEEAGDHLSGLLGGSVSLGSSGEDGAHVHLGGAAFTDVGAEQGHDSVEVKAVLGVGDDGVAVLTGDGVTPDAGAEQPVSGVMHVYHSTVPWGKTRLKRELVDNLKFDENGKCIGLKEKADDFINGESK